MLLACCLLPGKIIIKIFQYGNSKNGPLFVPNVSNICQIFIFMIFIEGFSVPSIIKYISLQKSVYNLLQSDKVQK